MIPKYRAWSKDKKILAEVVSIDFWSENTVTEYFRERDFEDVILMQSTGLEDKNGKEIFEGDILKFNDEWNDYCYEGYVDGSTEGINYVEIERETTCFAFGKTKISDSSLFYLIIDEHLSFEELIKDEDFEFEIIGNIYENPELLEVE